MTQRIADGPTEESPSANGAELELLFEQNFISQHAHQLLDIENNFFNMLGLPKPEQVSFFQYQPESPDSQNKEPALASDAKSYSSFQTNRSGIDLQEKFKVTDIKPIYDWRNAESQSSSYVPLQDANSHSSNTMTKLANQLCKKFARCHISSQDPMFESDDINYSQRLGAKWVWSNEQTEKLYNLLQKYGRNIQAIQKQFPLISKKQIKKKINYEKKMNPDQLAELLSKNNRYTQNKRLSSSNSSLYEKLNDSFITNIEQMIVGSTEHDESLENILTSEDFQRKQ